MTDKILIEGNVILYPNELHENFNELIVEKLNKKYLQCSRDYGCITRICKIHNKYNTTVERNSGCVKISLKFIVERILPIENKILTCKVDMIFNHGIFAQIGEHIKILVPATSIPTGKFIQNTLDGPIFEITEKINSHNNHRADSSSSESPSESPSESSSESPSESASDDTNTMSESPSGSASDDTNTMSESPSESASESASESPSESASDDTNTGSESASESASESSVCDDFDDSNDFKIIKISMNDIIKIKINEVKYTKNRYNCIASLINT